MISICTPVYDPRGKFKRYLVELIMSLKIQKLKPHELVLTSTDPLPYFDELVNLANEDFKLNFFLSNSNTAVSNTNFAVSKCSGDLIKILYMDDYLISENDLLNMANLLNESSSKWLISSFDHFDEENSTIIRPLKSRPSYGLRLGINTIGAPSVVMFKKEFFISFDENLTYMFDCDWYLRMLHNYGLPKIIETPTVRIRLHSNQLTHSVKGNLKFEIFRTNINHIYKFNFGRLCKCVNRF